MIKAIIYGLVEFLEPTEQIIHIAKNILNVRLALQQQMSEAITKS